MCIRDRASAYPFFLFFMAASIGIMFVTQVLPNFLPLFEEWDAPLPPQTILLVRIAELMSKHGPTVVAGFLAFVGIVLLWAFTAHGRWWLTRLLTWVPIIGPIYVRSTVASTTRTMGMLLSAGINVTDVVNVLTETTSNGYYASILARISSGLLSGARLSELVTAERFFPPLVSQLLYVGEESGTLVQNLDTVTKFFEREADRSVNTLIGIIEPAMIVSVGAVVAFIAASVVGPLYGVLQSIR